MFPNTVGEKVKSVEMTGIVSCTGLCSDLSTALKSLSDLNSYHMSLSFVLLAVSVGETISHAVLGDSLLLT